MTSLRVWSHGLAAAAISAFATAAGGFIALPNIFTFDKAGAANAARLVIVPTAIAVFGYLKASPMPVVSVTTTSTETVAVTKN